MFCDGKMHPKRIINDGITYPLAKPAGDETSLQTNIPLCTHYEQFAKIRYNSSLRIATIPLLFSSSSS